MHIIFFDPSETWQSLLPFTFTRPVASIRVGILTIAEKWQKRLNTSGSFATQAYLSRKFPLAIHENNLLINGAVCPDRDLAEAVIKLSPGGMLQKEGHILAINCNRQEAEGHLKNKHSPTGKIINYPGEITIIKEVYDIFRENGGQIRADFELLTTGRASAGMEDKHTIVYGAENIFIEAGVKIKAAILNAEEGPIYIGGNARIHEGAIVKGPFALCEGAHVNAGATIRGDCTIGPHSKVGGEMSNSVIFSCSNKSHDGFIGNSVIGDWCNLGAGTNTSNLKNNYTPVKLWNYKKIDFIDTGQKFCGLMMGDHTKCGINTMFNTGTVTGVSCNIFGAGFPATFIPSFSWGGAAGFSTYRLEKALEVAENVMGRRDKMLDDVEKDIFKYIFEAERENRLWFMGDR